MAILYVNTEFDIVIDPVTFPKEVKTILSGYQNPMLFYISSLSPRQMDVRLLEVKPQFPVKSL